MNPPHHLFIKCELFKLFLFAYHLGPHIPLDIDLNDWILNWLTCQDSLVVQLYCALLWKFWAGRNAKVFNGVHLDLTRLAMDVVNFIYEFNEANPQRGRAIPLFQSVREPSVYKFPVFLNFY
jgi:hypothetical protein